MIAKREMITKELYHKTKTKHKNHKHNMRATMDKQIKTAKALSYRPNSTATATWVGAVRDKLYFNDQIYVLDSAKLFKDIHCSAHIWARNPVFGGREQHRRRTACASTQSDQRLCYSLFRKHHI